MLNAIEGKSPHNIMMKINVVRYASVLNLTRKYSDARDIHNVLGLIASKYDMFMALVIPPFFFVKKKIEKS